MLLSHAYISSFAHSFNDMYFLSFQNQGGEENSGDTTKAKTQVRIVVRDMTGKHAWDFTLFFGPSSKGEGIQDPFQGWRSGSLVCQQQEPKPRK